MLKSELTDAFSQNQTNYAADYILCIGQVVTDRLWLVSECTAYNAHMQQSVGGVSYEVGSVLGELAFRCPASNDHTCTGGDGVT